MAPSEPAVTAEATASPAITTAAAEPCTVADGQMPSPSQYVQQQAEEHAGTDPDTVPAAQQQARHEGEQAPMEAAVADPPPDSSSPPPPPTSAPPPPTHRLKHVQQLPGGRSVPVVMQSENGPCPLLAIANVLLLRGNIYLPPGASEVTQERLIALVAEHLLDRNGEDSMAAGATDDFRANLARNVADAIELLPKLATGVDVNVRFTGIDAFEFTDEVAIFDLLGMQLVHGWLVDPQDTTTAAVVGNSSYNEMLARLTTADLEPAQPQPSAQPGTAREGAEAATAAAGSATRTAETTAATAAVPHRTPRAEELAAEEAAGREDSFDRNLRAALALSLGQEPPSHSAGTDAATDVAGPSLGAEAGPSTTGADGPAAIAEPATEDRTGDSGGADAFDAVLVERPSDADMAAAAREIAAHQAAQPAGPGDAASGEAGAGAGDAVASAGVLPSTGVDSADGAANVDLVPATSQVQLHDTWAPPVADTAVPAAEPEPESDALAPVNAAAEPEQRISFYEGSVIAEFLNTSQLTYHGLAALHEGLQPGALAVFFRNNHFNVLAKHADGALYLLVTDQGYLREPHVVWERLSGIDGDTAFCKADFTPYEGKSVAAAIVDADTAAAHNHDADLALALQMQEEEERADRAQRAARQQQQQQQTAEAASAGTRSRVGEAAAAAGAAPAAPHSGAAGRGRHARHNHGGAPAGRHSQITGQAPPKDKKECVVM